jgi:transketolase
MDRLRSQIADLVHASGEGHIPSSFSIVDILDVLYGRVLRVDAADPDSFDRDYFVLSKGHGALALYVVLAKYGLLDLETLATYGTADSVLGGHPDSSQLDFVEASTGSLGHGFPTSVGIALGLLIQGRRNRVYALLGDGECHEGTVWESANVAANQGLVNLTAIIDFNGSAAQLMPNDDMAAKWAAFGWSVQEVDGHSESQLEDALLAPPKGKPKAVVAHTTKGKGVSFIEGHGIWHHRVPNDGELSAIHRELGLK